MGKVDPEGQLDHKDHKALGDHQDKRVHLGQRDQLDLQALLVKEESLDLVDQMDDLVSLMGEVNE